MTKFFFKFKKPYFWSFLAHFPNFRGKKSFSMKSSCYARLLKGFWHHAKIQGKLMTGLTSKTAVNWYLKVKDIEYNVGLTKDLHHSQHAKNQLNS